VCFKVILLLASCYSHGGVLCWNMTHIKQLFVLLFAQEGDLSGFGSTCLHKTVEVATKSGGQQVLLKMAQWLDITATEHQPCAARDHRLRSCFGLTARSSNVAPNSRARRAGVLSTAIICNRQMAIDL